MSRNRNLTANRTQTGCHAVVIWIDWYAYHRARFTGLQSAFGYDGEIVGIELVGGVGVHSGLIFREDLPPDMPVETLMPQTSWHEANKFHLAKGLWRRLSSLNPDLVLVPGYYTLPGIVAALWAKINRRSSVLMTESTASDHVRSVWKETLKSGVIRALFDWAVTGGAAHVRYLVELGFPIDRIAGFYDVVDNDGIREKTTELRRITQPIAYGLPDNYFLFVGRLAPEKNVDGLLRSWISYRKNGGQWSLVLAGNGPKIQELQALTYQSEYSKDIQFLGHKSSLELLPLFSFANCLVLPSTREPWGLVVNEAMAASLPVIVSNRCGCTVDLVVQGHNGFIFNPDLENELAKCLAEMESLSVHSRKQMGRASADIIAKYSPQSFGNEIARIANNKNQEIRRESASKLVSPSVAVSADHSSNLVQVRRETTP